MKPAPFEYTTPHTLEETLALLNQHGPDAKLLAGGQSLVPAMNFRLAQPALLVDINRLEALDIIRPVNNGGLLVGAITRQRRLELDSLVAQRVPLLAEAMPYIAHPQIRNRGTLGGSLAHADPAAELPVIALALEARFKVCRLGSERWAQSEGFFQGIFTTEMEPEEMLTEVEFPPTDGLGSAFLEVARRQGDYAMMGVAVLLGLDERGLCRKARLVYLNAGDGPVVAQEAASLLLGQPINDESIREASEHASENEIDPWGNVHASPAFQRHLARVLARRALKLAYDRCSRSDKASPGIN